MEHAEKTALLSTPNPPKWWFRYVDDSHTCLNRNHVDEFHHHLNSINPHIQFTYEQETDRSLPFLDASTKRRENGDIEVTVYRKTTHTDKYLDFKSAHPLQHKRSVARSLFTETSYPHALIY